MANLAMATLPAPLASAGAFTFDNSFARELPGFYVARRPAVVPRAAVAVSQRPAGRRAGPRSRRRSTTTASAAIFAGNTVPDGAEPLAQAYAGHQFGGFSPQLGDGRALLLGEVIDRHGHRRDIAFKGSGRTPFARGGDGKAAVGPMLREVLIGEAMHALGIPTTRALAVAATGEQVFRERRAARRGADARRGEPHPRRHVPVLCRARRRRKRAQARRVHDRATRPRSSSTTPQPLPRAAAATWPSARRR